MVDFSAFDSILDAVFVVDEQLGIVFCNDPAATLCLTSVKRIMGKSNLGELIAFSEVPFPFGETSPGWISPSPYVETKFKLLKQEREGKVQLAVYPTMFGNKKTWIFVAHDVTLEEALHSKYQAELVQKEVFINEIQDARRKLEDYSHNLEKIVEERTKEVRRANESLNAVLNSLGQGFLTFNSAGMAGDVFTKACLDVLETNPLGKNVAEVLKVPAEKKPEFEMWLKALFSEALPFDDLKPLGPSIATHTQGRYITLDYYPIREEGKLRDVVTVATDKTTERLTQLELDRERQHAAMVIKFSKNKDQFLQFLVSARSVLEKIEEVGTGIMDAAASAESFRLLHTLEGESGTFSLHEVRLVSRIPQQILEGSKGQALPEARKAEYVSALIALREAFDKFLHDNSDLIHLPEGDVARLIEVNADGLKRFCVQLNKAGVSPALISSFQKEFLSEPVEKRFHHYDDLVQSVAERLGKKVKPLKIVGGGTRIRPEPYAALFASLVHVFRNAVDHGIEPADERSWMEKEEAGQITIQFSESADRYAMVISDDGRGIDPDSIRKKLLKTHPKLDISKQSDEEVIQNIFLPGFSSKETVGEFSGRGIGMDAVREEVGKLGGSVKVYSEAGKGSRFEFAFPVIGEPLEVIRSAS
jgi:two-component system, chemotaxis family, sensor kinase CheA